MGLGITFTSKPMLFNPIRQEKLDAAMTAMIEKEQLLGCNKQDTGYQIRICPVGDFFIRFQNGRLWGDIKTTVTGPGFHKACVEFLDGLGKELGISFAIQDETGYATNRDFKAMKRQMLDWLNKLFSQVVLAYDRKEYSGLCVCWDISSFTPDIDRGLITPSGLLDPDVVSYYVDQKQIEVVGNQFWVWSNESRDAYFYRGCALATMWCDVIWRSPETDEELKTINSALSFLEKASSLDRSIRLPVKEWEELCMLTGREFKMVENPPLEYLEAIGYRRGFVDYEFPRGYKARLPGSFKLDYDDDGTPVYYDGEKTFRLSVFSIDGKQGQDFRNEMHHRPHDFHSEEKRLEFTKDDYRYLAEYGRTKEENKEFGILHGQVGGSDKLAVVTICWVDPSEEQWALDTFRFINVAKGYQYEEKRL